VRYTLRNHAVVTAKAAVANKDKLPVFRKPVYGVHQLLFEAFAKMNIILNDQKEIVWKVLGNAPDDVMGK
jgi:hypothetical protein